MMHRAPPFGVGPYGIPVPVGGGGVQQDMANQQAMAQQALAQQAALAAAYQAQLQAPGYFAATAWPLLLLQGVPHYSGNTEALP